VGSVAGVAGLYLCCNVAYFAVLAEADIVASAAVRARLLPATRTQLSSAA
jgi:hypothetical protein